MFGTKSYIEPYLFKFLKADAAFLYQYVFDMDTRTYTYLNPIPPSMNREHVSLLGDDPRNRFIYLLRANRPIIDPRANQKENVNVSIYIYVYLNNKANANLIIIA